MSSVLDKILSDPVTFCCDAKKLGPCSIPSPVRERRYVADGERVFATENATYAQFAKTRLGHLPTFEKAGPKERIFHDPSWTRVGIVGSVPAWGSFVDGVGLWDGDDKDGETPIIVRGAWDQITPRSCRWYQAVSRDDGKTWEDSWVMHWTRV